MPCGVCGAPRPAQVVFCRACNHYDVWFERSAVYSSLRQLVVGTVLVGLLSVLVNYFVDSAISDSDERRAERERLAELRERLVRHVVRATSGIERCPTARGEDGFAACVEWIRRLRGELREEIFSLDWTVPLRFPARGRPMTSAMVERALDLSADAARQQRRVVDRLDERWALCQVAEAPATGAAAPDGRDCEAVETLDCAAVDQCRALYARLSTYCVTWIACGAFQLASEHDQISASCEAFLADREFCGDPAPTTRDVATDPRLCKIAASSSSALAQAWVQQRCRP